MKKIKVEVKKVRHKQIVFNGKGIVLFDNSNIYGCVLNENVFVGPFVEIQNNVNIGKNSRIQSHTFICSNVTIDADCFIGHGVMFINDKFNTDLPRGDPKKLMKTYIGCNVKIGSGSVILPVKICNDVIIGAGTVVTKDILVPGVYVGNPLRRIR